MKGVEDFEGVATTLIKNTFEDEFGKFVSNTYVRVTKSALVFYGYANGSSRTVVTPPSKTPTNLEEGETFKQTVTYKTFFGNGSTAGSKWKSAITFLGIETIKTPLGKFAACKFETKSSSKITDVSAADASVETSWVAAEGPYRGFGLKSVSGKPATTYEVVKIREFDVK
ncbi:hypothetical protein [Chenggangzhangella methanolivorans]|uniref:Uncharacterized protein n=1 Tax=Chenggangzhangella methanolivorans TaxID=1437009 RepID=A0A9E6R7K7_9HYPH|nr:hypothetical protein [Chenggangzhangella methanolivorans]QZN99680.1 hypothetical protein K6K41_23860 [Chenggangzhangella methanolivorans]